MLLPIQPCVSHKRALVLVHGLYGFIPYRRGRALAAHLGGDQPIYGLEARGYGGGPLPPDTVTEAAQEYLTEIKSTGVGVGAPFAISAICEGYVFALEMAHQLAMAGDPPPLLLLVDPPGAPPGGVAERMITPAVASHYRDHAREWFAEASGRAGELPFELGNRQQLDRAAEVAMTITLSICRHRTKPYAGRVDILATGDRAEQINRADWPWRNQILMGVWTLTKLNCSHQDLFSRYAGVVFDWLTARLATLDAPIAHDDVRLS
jgi:thioesterase domain-containing protein